MTPNDEGTSELAETVARDLEEAARVLLAKHSAIRSLVITVDWSLPKEAAARLPATMFKTQRGTFTANDIGSLIRRVQGTILFLVDHLFRWFQTSLERAQKATGQPLAPVPPPTPTTTGSGAADTPAQG